MANISAIPDNLLPLLIGKTNDGWTHAKIAEWLKLEHSIDVTAQAVSQRLRKLRKIEQEAKKLAIQEAASKSAVDCISILDTNINLLNQQAVTLLSGDSKRDKQLGNMLANTLLKYIDSKMNLTGINKEDYTPEEQDLVDGLLKKLNE